MQSRMCTKKWADWSSSVWDKLWTSSRFVGHASDCMITRRQRPGRDKYPSLEIKWLLLKQMIKIKSGFFSFFTHRLLKNSASTRHLKHLRTNFWVHLNRWPTIICVPNKMRASGAAGETSSEGFPAVPLPLAFPQTSNLIVRTVWTFCFVVENADWCLLLST